MVTARFFIFVVGTFLGSLLLSVAWAIDSPSPALKATPKSERHLVPTTGVASDPAIAAFDKRFIAFLKKWRAPGAALVVMKNGRVLVERGYGWADVEQHEPATANHLFRIASVSKTFTATAILKLVQDGKLHLNDRVFTILNDLKPLNGHSMAARVNDITVLNLLQMSSGWFAPGSGHLDPLFGPWPQKIRSILNPEFGLPASCEITTRMMMSMPLRYKPGSNYAYSNLDYCILGLVINKVTGSQYGYAGYEQYVKNQILAPLGITDMFIGSTQARYRAKGEVHYYQDRRSAGQDELTNSFYLPYSQTEILKKNFGNGGWVASAKDVATFIQALHSGRILTANSLRLMQSKPAFRRVDPNKGSFYTIGGQVYRSQGKTYLIETGSFTGTNALIVTKPNGVTLAVIFNYRPSAYSFLSKFRPELRALLINNTLGSH